jgi:hypothetical protein
VVGVTSLRRVGEAEVRDTVVVTVRVDEAVEGMVVRLFVLVLIA